MQLAESLPSFVSLLLGAGVLAYCVSGFRRAGYRLRYGMVAVVGALMVLDAVSSLLADVRWPWLSAVVSVASLLTLLAIFVGYFVLAVFLLVNGVVLLRREGRRISNALSLAAGLWMVALPFAPFLVLLVGPLGDAGTVLFAAVFSALLLGTAYLGFCFLGFLISAVGYRRFSARLHPRYIIVLGAGLVQGRVTPLLAGRIGRALELYRRERALGREPVLIPSGGRGPDEPRAEGEAMREYMVEQGIPPESILVEDRAATTSENLRFSRELIDAPEAEVSVVTSDYHVYRAAMLMRREGLRGTVTGSRTAAYYVPSAFLREFAAIMVMNRVAHLVVLGVMTLAVAGFFGLAYAAGVSAGG
ncbi:YdcF family protein [Rothia halotolerans]|uniref:YdcF family protein n=1 Tax=Rothia halotolerans TaxID=405770 RepID=UPI00101CAAE7|nr:YdcF family protein [Rothia halotolerans]